jgi:hypothetical protein
MRAGVLLGIALAAAVVGCGGQKADNTPKDALVKAGDALLKGDKDAYLANVKLRQGDQAFTEAMLETRRQTRALIEAMRKALGDKVAKEFEDQDQPVMAAMAKQADTLKFIEEGNVAEGTTPDKREIRFIMEGNHWRVDMSQLKPASPEAMKEEKVTAQALRKVLPQIGKPGFETKEDIEKALMAEMRKALSP